MRAESSARSVASFSEHRLVRGQTNGCVFWKSPVPESSCHRSRRTILSATFTTPVSCTGRLSLQWRTTSRYGQMRHEPRRSHEHVPQVHAGRDQVTPRQKVWSMLCSREAVAHEMSVLKPFVTHGRKVLLRKKMLVLCLRGDWRNQCIECFLSASRSAQRSKIFM